MLAAKYSACRPSANDLLKALETVVVDKIFNGDSGNAAYNERQADHPWAEDIRFKEVMGEEVDGGRWESAKRDEQKQAPAGWRWETHDTKSLPFELVGSSYS